MDWSKQSMSCVLRLAEFEEFEEFEKVEDAYVYPRRGRDQRERMR